MIQTTFQLQNNILRIPSKYFLNISTILHPYRMTTPPIFKNILLEIRPRLQSINVFINLNRECSNFDIQLKDDHFILILDGNNFKVDCGEFKVVNDSLTNIIKDSNFISFRFTTNSNLGSFKSEIFKPNLSTKNFNHKTTCFLSKKCSYSITCGNCTEVLIDNVIFARILPLPSENLEHSDWFCHQHSEDSAKFSLNPNLHDIFYSNCYFYLHLELLNKCDKSKKVISCKQCGSWLGLILNESSAKLWFNTVSFENKNTVANTLKFENLKINEDASKILANDEVTKIKSNPLEDVLNLIKMSLQDSFVTSSKIVLNCPFFDNTVKHLIIWVVENKLQMKIYEHKWQNLNVAKVLFKFEPEQTVLDDVLRKDANACSMTVSKVMLESIVEHLQKMHDFIPKIYSVSNGFYVSYVSLYN